MQSHFPLLYVGVLRHGLAPDSPLESLELLVVADGLQAIAGEDDGVAAGYVDALMTPQDAAHVYAEPRAETQLLQRLPRPARVFRYVEVGDVDVAVDELVLEERPPLPADLCGNVARVEILYEPPLNAYRPALELAREHHEHDNDHGKRYDDGVGKACEVVADVEEDGGGDGHAEEHGENERQAVEPALGPQGLELVAVVVLHHQRAHERRYADERDQPRRAVGPPVGQQMAEKL